MTDRNIPTDEQGFTGKVSAVLTEYAGHYDDWTSGDVQVLDLAREADAEIVRLRAALVKSVAAIQTWHNQGIPVRECSKLWDIYWRNAPEMKPIREALSALDVPK